MKYSEDMNYFDTTVHPAKSLGEIQELLSDFGVTNMIVTQGSAGDKLAWLVRFQWNDRSYHFVFQPLACRWPAKVSSFGGKKRAHEEQSKYQMGRIAVYFVKAILTAAEMNQDALFGFLELPGMTRTGGIPPTAAQVDVSEFVGLLPNINLPQLEDGK